MDKRKDYTLDDKLQIVKEILETTPNHNKIKLELTIYSQVNNNNYLGKLCDKFKLHKKVSRQDNFEWTWYHNGPDKQNILDANILISVFK